MLFLMVLRLGVEAEHGSASAGRNNFHLKIICLSLTYQCKTLICLGRLLVMVISKNVDATFCVKLNDV